MGVGPPEAVPVPSQPSWMQDAGGVMTIPGSDYWKIPGNETYDETWACGPIDSCFCEPWYTPLGTDAEKTAATASKWIVFATCVINLMYYGWSAWKATCGWEEVYVTVIEIIHVSLGIWHHWDSPATLWLSTGNMAVWLRYAEWLLCCPVILIHLANLTGMKNNYNKRTMTLLVGIIGCLVFGATAAMAITVVKIIMFLISMIYFCIVFFDAAKVYIESYHTVPKGVCRLLVRIQATLYFIAWSMYPILFVLGPEGFGKISAYGSVLAHEILDLFAKNTWTFLGHLLRIKIHQHILKHGNLVKKTKIMVAGEEREIETYVDDQEEGYEDLGTAELANRQSFVIMRDRMKAKGETVRASLGSGEEDGNEKSAMFASMSGMGAMAGPPMRVVLVATEANPLAAFFRQQFAEAGMANTELVPAVAPQVALQLAQQAMAMGGPSYIDFFFLHPEQLADRSPNGLPARLKAAGYRVFAFGMGPAGPFKDLIEGAMSQGLLDGAVEGPTPTGQFAAAQLAQIARVVQMTKQMAPVATAMPTSMANPAWRASNGSMGPGAMAGSMAAPMPGSMVPAYGGMPSSNPLYGSAPSPMGSAPNHPAPAGVSPEQEAQLMGSILDEIQRLKQELGTS